MRSTVLKQAGVNKALANSSNFGLGYTTQYLEFN